MNKAVVTGCAGFIGSRLAKTLIEDGWDSVVGIDRMSSYYSSRTKVANLQKLSSPRFHFVPESINRADLEELVSGADVIFHQAGQPGVRKSWGRDFDEYVSDNVVATQMLLEAAAQSRRPPKFVYASSSSVYGNADKYPVVETDLPKPVSPYGATKLAAEHLVGVYAANLGLETVSLRYFTVYGPAQRPDMAFTRLCAWALRGQSVQIYGSGDQIRDFTYVDDVVDANVKAFEAPTAPGSVYNISGGSNASLNECINVIEELYGRPVRRDHSASALGDVHRTGGSSQKARLDIGWEAKTSLRAGLGSQFAWVRGELGNIELT